MNQQAQHSLCQQAEKMLENTMFRNPKKRTVDLLPFNGLQQAA
jgi:hypothetical protein